MRWGKVLLIVGTILLLGLFGMLFFGSRPASRTPAGGALSQFIQADFIDLDRIETISKFRSGEGHDFSSHGETCRSMKHYFSPAAQESSQPYRQSHEGLPPPPDGVSDIVISSPIDGIITSIDSEQAQFGAQVSLRPAAAKEFTVRLFHVYLDEGIGKGSSVTASQRIGVISAGQNTDIAVQYGRFQGEFVSYFSVMSDSVFAAYKTRGVASREALIITKEARDADPLTCQGEQFAHPADYERSQDFVTLAPAGSVDSIGEPPPGSLDQGQPPSDADAKFPPTHSSNDEPSVPLAEDCVDGSGDSVHWVQCDADSADDEPPLLLKSIGFELGTYDPATNRAGDFEFTKQKLQFNRLLMGYGFHIPADQTGGGSAKDNPQPTFIVPLGTKVRSLVDGVVTNVSELYSDDVSVMVASDTKSQWMYETEHVVNPVVKVGDRVTAGQVVAEAANFNNNAPAGFGIFEIGILKGGNPPQHVCPFAHLDPSIKADVQAKLLQFYKDWEVYTGDPSLHDESESPIGCLTTDPIDG